jgi:hypothetical protein
MAAAKPGESAVGVPPPPMAAAPAPAASEGSEASAINSKEIHTYKAPWMIYGLAASMREGPEYAFRYAVGSFIEEYSNKVWVRAPQRRVKGLRSVVACFPRVVCTEFALQEPAVACSSVVGMVQA